MTGVAVIGCGQISDLHLAAYADRQDATITALADVRPQAAQRQRDRFGLGQAVVTAEYREVLARPDVDLVEILVPHQLHRRVALEALHAGKHVSLQKPMGISMAEADDLVAGAAASSGCARVFENFLFYPPVMRAKQIIDSGELGDILTIRLKSAAGYNPAAWPPPAEPWRSDRERCGGGQMVFDDGHHKFALAWYLGGLAEVVHAFIESRPLASGAVLDVPALVSWRYASGALGSFEATYSPGLFVETGQYPQDDRIEVTGTKGIMWVTRGHGRLLNVPPVVVSSSAPAPRLPASTMSKLTGRLASAPPPRISSTSWPRARTSPG
ncbi:MAG: Gfo/Idh/MocA family protein [Streptosporangiaceae bacterium]